MLALHRWLILACISFLGITQQARTAHIIFDLGGVLIETNTMSAFWHVGPLRCLYFCASTFKSPRHAFFDFLNSVFPPENTTQCPKDEFGTPLPSIMAQWLRGELTLEELNGHLADGWSRALFASQTEAAIVKNILEIAFDPCHFIRTRSIINDALELVIECIEQGHTVYILSNWDPHTFTLLEQTYPEIFSLFGDRIVISGNVGILKPDPRIYHHILSRYNLKAHECVYIDDQQENIDSALLCGIPSIHCPKKRDVWSVTPDIDHVRLQLQAVLIPGCTLP